VIINAIAVAMRVAVIGSRTFADYAALADALHSLHGASSIAQVVSGGANGADQLAERWAAEHGIGVTVLRPDWAAHGKGAAAVRNKLIVKEADLVVAFWDGHSPGTRMTLDMARAAGKRVHVHRMRSGAHAASRLDAFFSHGAAAPLGREGAGGLPSSWLATPRLSGAAADACAATVRSDGQRPSL
jgi:hypothetical protein